MRALDIEHEDIDVLQYLVLAALKKQNLVSALGMTTLFHAARYADGDDPRAIDAQIDRDFQASQKIASRLRDLKAEIEKRIAEGRDRFSVRGLTIVWDRKENRYPVVDPRTSTTLGWITRDAKMTPVSHYCLTNTDQPHPGDTLEEVMVAMVDELRDTDAFHDD